MTDAEPNGRRRSALPSILYQSGDRARFASRSPRGGFYSRMLKDDLTNLRYAYDISLTTDAEDGAKSNRSVLALLDDFNRFGYHEDPGHFVCNLVDELFEESLDSKALLLELHWLPTEHQSNRRGARRVHNADAADKTLPSLGLMPNWSVKRARAGLSQVEPDDRQRRVTVPWTRIHGLKLDRSSRNAWRRSTRALELVDGSKLIDAGMDRMHWKGFSFSDVVDFQAEIVASSTAAIGWDARGTFKDTMTSPYMTYRRLRFARLWVQALNNAVLFLNRFTTDKSLYGENAFSFSLSGLPTDAELEHAMDDLRRGTLTVDDAYHNYLFPRNRKRGAG